MFAYLTSEVWTTLSAAFHGGAGSLGAPEMSVFSSLRTPSFSVVIPLYNKQSFVRRTLRSVLGQEYGSFEVIIVDDSSTDGSGETIADLLGGNVRMVRQPNAGPSAARNHGCRIAGGEWIAFIDADDLWTPGHLGALSRIVAAQPEAQVVATTSRQLPAGQTTETLEERRETAIRAIDYLAGDGEAIVHTSSVAVLRSAFARCGGFGPFCPGEDEELWARLALDCRFAVSDAATSIYLRANGGIMDQMIGTGIAPITVATSPVGQTLRAALADPGRSDRHAAVQSYMRRLQLRDARICLYAGYPTAAREILRKLGPPTSLQLTLYWTLALMPARFSRRIVRLYSRLRSRLSSQPRSGTTGA